MIRYRVPRLLIGGALVAITFVTAAPMRAQGILGRARDRARQALSGNQAPERCDANQPVNGDFVTRYIRSLQARETELRRLAGENSRTGRYFAAMLRQDSSERRRNDYHAETGPDWARAQALNARLRSGDASAVQALSALNQFLEERVELPDGDFSDVSAASARMDTVMMQGGGFTKCNWLAVGEAIPGAVAQIARDSTAPIERVGLGGLTGLTEDGIAAVRAHRMELVRLLKLPYKSGAMIAREQRERAQQDSMTNAMNAWQACQQRLAGGPMTPQAMGAHPDSMRIWQQQLEDAQKRGDQATIMALGMKMGMAMAPGMQQRAAAQQQANQQCGPMPGTPTGAPK